MLEHALKYWTMGWSVIPIHTIKKGKCSCGSANCNSPGKHPRPDGWTAYQKRRPTKAEVKAWWKKWPDANIAVITGKISGIVVIDVDDTKQYKPMFDRAKTARTATTGSGGKHLFYQYPDNVELLGNRAGFIKGVDFRGDGGYVVLPPSNHKSGNDYKWSFTQQPGKLPKDLVKQLSNDPSERSKDATGKERYWLDDLLQNGPAEGERNSSVTKLAGYYAGKGLPEDVCLSTIEQWAENRMPGYGRDFTYKELVTTVRSVYRTDTRRGKPRRFDSSGAKESDDDREVSTVFESLTLDRFLSKFGSHKVKWAISGWLPVETIQFIIAAPESFKTWILLDYAISLAGGKDFLGNYPVEKAATGTVLVVQQEDHHGQTAERMASIICTKYGLTKPVRGKGRVKVTLPPSLPIFIHTEASLRVDDIDIMDALEDFIVTHKIKYVFIDPLYSFIKLTNYGADSVQALMRLKELRTRYGVTFILAHHTSKKGKDTRDKEKNQDVEDMQIDREEGWGSQLINGFIESGIQIRKSKFDNVIALKRHFKSAKSDDRPSLYKFDINLTTSPIKYQVDRVTSKDVENEVDLVDYITKNGPKQHKDLVEETGMSAATITRRLKVLTKDGILEKDAKSRYILAKKKPKF